MPNCTPAKISWNVLGPFAFSVFLFYHPFEGSDIQQKQELSKCDLVTPFYVRRLNWCLSSLMFLAPLDEVT